jgi:hypothetical protein
LSIDPLVGETDQPYVFTNDNPLNAEDPLGQVYFDIGNIDESGGAPANFGAATGEEPSGVATAPPVRVIGHYPIYVEVAETEGGRFFSIPEDIYRGMSPEEQWRANVKFLDRGIAKGEEFKLATPADEIRPGSSLAKEVNFILERGYEFNAAKTALIPRG